MSNYEAVQRLADEARGMMESRTRDGGETFVCFKDGAPEWMNDLAHEAHGGMMPEDWRYSFIRDALDALGDSEDEEDARDEIKPSDFAGDRLAWLASNLSRTEYVNDAVAERDYPQPFDLSDALAWGMYAEAMEVFDSVFNYLSGRVEDEDEDEDEDEAA